MKLNIIIAFLCINFALGLANFPGSPVYAGSSENCFYRSDTAPTNDVVVNQTGTGLPGLGIDNQTALDSELAYPKNATLVGGILEGTQTFFNNIYEAGEGVAKSVEVFKNLVRSNYAVDVIGNFAVNCHLAANGTLIAVDADPNTPGTQSPAIWTYFLNGIKAVMVILTVIMVFYVLTGKGFILSS